MLLQRTVVDADHLGGWTQIFGNKASEPETSRSVEKLKFYLSHLYLASPLAVIPSEFRRGLLRHKTIESLDYRVALFVRPFV